MLQSTQIAVGEKTYSLHIGYPKHEKYRAAFDSLTQKVFNLSFETWYQAGYLNEKYIPYTLFDGSKAIANASINIMDFNVFGKPKRYIQIGTVATDQKYRHQGLSRFLLKHILTDWNGRCDFIYLFANHTALDFYPKFGFEPFKEYEYSQSITNHSINVTFESVNMDLAHNRDKLYQYVKNSSVFSSLSMQENADLVMFYAITVMREHVFYSKLLDTFAIATMNDNQLHLLGIFSPHKINLNQVINGLIHFEHGKVLLGFTPQDPHGFQAREICSDDVLFIQAEKDTPFVGQEIMFPLLSHA